MSLQQRITEFRTIGGTPSRAAWSELPPETRQRAIGIALAVLFEVLLIALLLSLGKAKPQGEPDNESLVTFAATDVKEAPEPAKEPEKAPEKAAAAPQPRPEPPKEQPDSPQVPTPEKRAPALISVSPDTMRQLDIARVPPARPAQAAGPVGPADTARPGDSQRIAGSGPNGEPLYAARWYREPTHDELAGYLSTASGPGWGLINCQTAPKFRVENCVLVGEAPQGSGIGRAVLAAAWQFKVRPPQVGGRPQVGEWVRIRIDYTISRTPPPG
ncbi:hypothetical protein [Erythrobacter sp.]|uniref:hypothetical protein n=1 Tax=Erythrobacter sp. TaxID=1042 RepID=UPI00311E60F7